jgi:hypothetical protein
VETLFFIKDRAMKKLEGKDVCTYIHTQLIPSQREGKKLEGASEHHQREKDGEI